MNQIGILGVKMPDFKSALSVGKIIENLWLARLKRKSPMSMIIEGSFKDFDIYQPEKHLRYEVKSDMKSIHTGNFLIEVEHYKKPSALMTTKADYWVFYDRYNWIVVPPKKIKDLILTKGYKQVKTTGKGDRHYKLCYLVKKNDIKEIAYVIKCDKEEVYSGGAS